MLLALALQTTHSHNFQNSPDCLINPKINENDFLEFCLYHIILRSPPNIYIYIYIYILGNKSTHQYNIKISNVSIRSLTQHCNNKSYFLLNISGFHAQ